METVPATCYRHADRRAGVSCQRCSRPICPSCMVQASVGFHCPECVSQAAKSRPPTPQIRWSGGKPAIPVTKALIGINAAVFLVVLATSRGQLGGTVADQGALVAAARFPGSGPGGVAMGEWWRLVTSGFLHANVPHILFNMFALWVLGSFLEPALGARRYVALYFVSLLAGSFGALLLSPLSLTVGASGAVYGLMGAALALQRSQGIDPFRSGLLTLIGINLLLTFWIPNISVGGHLGGLAGGLLCGAAIFGLEKRRMSETRVLAVLVIVGAGFVAGGLWAAAQWTSPLFG